MVEFGQTIWDGTWQVQSDKLRTKFVLPQTVEMAARVHNDVSHLAKPDHYLNIFHQEMV